MNRTLLLEKLILIVGNNNFITDSDKLYNYSRDITLNDLTLPIGVVIPGTVQEVARVVKLCNQNRLMITIRGGGTGVSGGSVPSGNGIILSLERLNRIVEINEIDRTATVEAGVITRELQKAAMEKNLWFPQNISSSDSCFIGGNVAVSSGSPKSLKYGPTKNYVLNLQVVLADGSIIWTGKNVTKNATGFNLTQLFIGSEGTLGIITQVVLQLVRPVPETLLLIPFDSLSNLFSCVKEIFTEDYNPSSIEFIDKTGYDLVSGYVGKKITARKNIEGLLWIELEEENSSALEVSESLSHLINKYSSEEVFIAQSKTEINNLWSFRKKIGKAVIGYSSFKDIDIVVPRSEIYNMYLEMNRAAAKSNIMYTAFGHIGNGNFHVNIIHGKTDEISSWKESADLFIKDVFESAIELGGTISGEHGIGTYRLPYLKLALTEEHLNLMRGIKQVFDPGNILNSNKA